MAAKNRKKNKARKTTKKNRLFFFVVLSRNLLIFMAKIKISNKKKDRQIQTLGSYAKPILFQRF